MSTDISWPRCRNARDVGELPAADGRRVVSRALVRADRLSRLTDEGRAALRAYGVSRIVDLRRDTECTIEPNPFASESMYVNLPVQDPADPEGVPTTMDDLYRMMLDRRQQLFTTAVTAIADAPPGAVVVHCHAGKDRTGVVVGLALTAVGVPHEAVVDDYARSAVRLAARRDTELAAAPDDDERARLSELWSSRPETMTATLDHLTRRYGGTLAYLEGGGMTVDQLDRLRARLLG